jgi:D-ribose pyranase
LKANWIDKEHRMKKTPLLHAELSGLIARLGHGDMLVIGDAGLPIPEGPQRIDLAVTANVPRFMEVVRAVLHELQVESAVIAEELPSRNPAVETALKSELGTTPVTQISHEEFKILTAKAHAIVRTGEFSPYANVILRAGVVF